MQQRFINANLRILLLLSQISVIPKLVKPAFIALNLKKPLSPKLILKIVIFKILSLRILIQEVCVQL